MKILFYMHDNDWRYNSLSNILSGLGSLYSVGVCGQSISQSDISTFKPDIIIHNKPGTGKFPAIGEFVSINFNSFKGSPYCVFSQWSRKNFSPKYSSKTLYIGNPLCFNGSAKKLLSDDSFGFKFFLNNALPLVGYSGACFPREESLFYHGAKASIYIDGDEHRLTDILMADGNPVAYCGDDDRFLEELRESLSGKAKDPTRRLEILENHTDYDRLSQMFDSVGLKKVASSIKELKIRKINEDNAVC